MQHVSPLLASEETDVAEAAMDVLLEYSQKKQIGASTQQAGTEWTSMVQQVLLYPCRRTVRPC